MITRGRSFSGRERNCVFLNTGGERFADVSAATGLDLIDDGRAVALVDWDHDGDLDIWIANRTGPRVRLLRNDQQSGNHFLALRLQGTTCNRDAIGARVELFLTGEGNRKVVRTLTAGDGFVSQSSKWLHFGIARGRTIERVAVHWPGQKTAEEFRDVLIDGRWHIVQGTGTAVAAQQQPRDVKLTPSQPAVPASTDKARIVLTAPLALDKLEYEDFSGQRQPLRQDGDGPMLITLWASWCRPCRKELKEFSDAYEKLSARHLRIVALCTEAIEGSGAAGLSAARSYVEDSRFPFSMGIATGELLRSLTLLHHAAIRRERPLPLPSSFLVDRQGRVMAIYKGSVSVEQLMRELDHLKSPPDDMLAEAFPFAGRSAMSRFSVDALGSAQAYRDGGYLDDARAELAKMFSGPAPQSAPAKRRRIQAYHLLGQIEREQKRYDRMVGAYQKALQLLPSDPSLHIALAVALSKNGQPEKAEEHFRAALASTPESPQLMMMVGRNYVQLGKFDRGIELYRSALERLPKSDAIRIDLAFALDSKGDVSAAIEQYQRVLKQNANSLDAANNLAWLYATQSDANHRNAAEALKLARQACKTTEHQRPGYLDTLAAAHAANGDFSAAVKVARDAILLAGGSGQQQLTEILQARLQLYLAKKPYREPAAREP